MQERPAILRQGTDRLKPVHLVLMLYHNIHVSWDGLAGLGNCVLAL